MVEMLITGGLIATAAFVVTRRPAHMSASGAVPVGGDLPCPWCRADTSEKDNICPGCGQVFG
ncbi:MAG: hypothetical protein OES13_02575 [Acidimicrobiia bacterium]|nr:hypothetical protein [Acidimicrobiia bacterium]